MIEILLIGLLFIYRYVWRLNFFNPAFLILIVWTIGYICYLMFPTLYAIEFETKAIVGAYLILFSLTSILIQGIFKRYTTCPRININTISYVNEKLLIFLNYLAVFGGIFYIYRYVSLYISIGDLSYYFYLVRSSALLGESLIDNSGRLMGNLPSFSMIIFVILFYVYLNKKTKNYNSHYKFLLIVGFLSSSLMQLVEGARSGLVQYLLILFAIYFLSGRTLTKKFIGYFSLIVFLFGVISVFSRIHTDDKNIFEIAYLIMEHIVLYAYGSLKSIDYFFNENIFISHGTFYGYISSIDQFLELFMLNKLDIKLSIEQMQFVEIGPDLFTNVYSFLAVYIFYFGFLGTVLTIIGVSIVVTIIYQLKNNHSIFLLLYAVIVPAIILTTFHDYFFAYIPYFVRVVLLSILIFYKFKIDIKSIIREIRFYIEVRKESILKKLSY